LQILWPTNFIGKFQNTFKETPQETKVIKSISSYVPKNSHFYEMGWFNFPAIIP
jgi:hypothetical protein